MSSSSLGVWSEFLRLSPLTENKEIWSARVCFLAVVELVGSVSPLPSWCRRTRTRCATFIRMNGPIQDCGDPNNGRAPGPPPRDLALLQASHLIETHRPSETREHGRRLSLIASPLSQFQKRLSFCPLLSLSLFGGLTE